MSSFSGIYFDGEVARGRPVAVTFGDDAVLRIAGEGFGREISLTAVRVSDRLGDVPRFIRLPDGGVIETPDNESVDAALADRRLSRGARLIHLLESRQWIAVVGCVVLLATVIVLGVFGPPALARTVARRVPADVDQRIGVAALAAIRPYFSTSTLSDEERERVQRQLDRLEADPLVPRARLEFRSMKGGLPNAFGLPGNVIVMTDELVRLPASNDELAAVFAHELGHLKYRHGLQSLLRNSFAVLIVAAVTGDVSTLTSFAATIPMTILTAGYSRDLEGEADRYALQLLRARGINPHAFATVLVKLENSRPKPLRRATYLSTHPDTEERIALFGGITPADRKALLAEPWLERAAEHAARREYDAAMADCSSAIEAVPSAEAYLLRAKYGLADNQPDEARADIEKALQLDPKSIAAQVERTEILATGLGQYDEAIRAAKGVLRAEPKNGRTAALLGWAEMAKGDKATAAVEFDHAIIWSPTDFHGWAYRAEMKSKSGDSAGALADYDKAIQNAPGVEWLYVGRGTARLHEGRFDGALADFSRVTAPQYQTPEFFYARGLAEHRLGRLDQAVSDYGRALDGKMSARRRMDVHMSRAGAHMAKHDYAAALSDADTVIALDPKFAPAYFQRGLIRMTLHAVPEAIADFDQAEKHGFDETLVRTRRADANWLLENYDAAIADMDRLIADHPNGIAYETRGMIELCAGDLARAEADMSAYFTVAKPRTPEYVWFFRLITRRIRQVDAGEAEFAATVDSWPDCWGRIVGLYLSGRLSEELFLAETSSGGTPTPIERRCEAYFYIGVTHELAGDNTTAERFYRKCLDTGVGNYYEFKLARSRLKLMEAR